MTRFLELQLVMQLGVLTIASLSTWDGSTSKSCKLLLMVPGPHDENTPKLIVNIQAITKDKDSGPLRSKPLTSAVQFNSQEETTATTVSKRHVWLFSSTLSFVT